MNIKEVLKIENLGKKYVSNLSDNEFILAENKDDKLVLLNYDYEFSIIEIFELVEILNAKFKEID